MGDKRKFLQNRGNSVFWWQKSPEIGQKRFNDAKRSQSTFGSRTAEGGWTAAYVEEDCKIIPIMGIRISHCMSIEATNYINLTLGLSLSYQFSKAINFIGSDHFTFIENRNHINFPIFNSTNNSIWWTKSAENMIAQFLVIFSHFEWHHKLILSGNQNQIIKI